MYNKFMEFKRSIYGIGLAMILMLVSLFTLSCGEQDDVVGITISGKVTLTNTTSGVADITVKITGDLVGSAITDIDGLYSFSELQSGTYYLEPVDSDYTFDPDVFGVFTETSAPNINFTATAVTP